MRLTKLSTALAIGLMATTLCFPGDAQEPAKTSKEAEPNAVKRQTSAPEYDAKGNLVLPPDFKTWVFVGANLGLDYQQDVAANTPREKKARESAAVGDFHNVYINPEAYKAYLETGKFPEKTVLVMDVYQAKDKEPQNVVIGGHFQRQSLGGSRSKKQQPTGRLEDGLGLLRLSRTEKGGNCQGLQGRHLLRLPQEARQRRQCVGAVLPDHTRCEEERK